MSELKRLKDVVFEELTIKERLKYLKNSLQTEAPVFHKGEPDLKRNRLFHNLANKPLRTWGLITFILAFVNLFAYRAEGYNLTIAIVIWSILAALVVLYIVYRKKVNAFFVSRNDKLNARYAKDHAAKLEKYHAELSEHNEELQEYQARELTYEQAKSVAEEAIASHGLFFGNDILGVNESELIAFHLLKKPKYSSTCKKYGEEQLLYASYLVQFIYLTEHELYELSGEVNLLTDELGDYTSSKVQFAKVSQCRLMSNESSSINYYGIMTENNSGGLTETVTIPSALLRPRTNYYIHSVSWKLMDKDRPDFNLIQSGRRQANKLLKKPLSYDEFTKAVEVIQNLNCLDYRHGQEETDTPEDRSNLDAAQLIVERAINRKVRESSMR